MKATVARVMIAGLFLLPIQQAVSVEVFGIFNHNMVLQRDAEVPVWGRGVPGEHVAVEFDDQVEKTVVDRDGVWRVVLSAMPAGGPFKMSIIGGNDSIVFKNILVGDVWICSGQSNMQFQMKYSEDADVEMAKAKYSEIRLFFADQRVLPEPADDIAGKWYACSPVFVQNFSAVGYYFGKELFEQLDVPIGLINASRGGTPVTAWMSEKTQRSDPAFSEICKSYEEALKLFPEEKNAYDAEMETFREQYPTDADYVKACNEANAKRKDRPVKPSLPYLSPGGLWQPSGCYNAYISPLAGFKIKGVIWYQGENDVSIAYLYRRLLPALINDWRDLFEEKDLPFGIVQLPGYGKTFPDCRDNQWAELREAQLLTAQTVPNTGLIVTIDIGDANNLHPKNKRDVGYRLARWALADVYGQEISWQGPVYKSFSVEGDKIRIRFRGNEELASTDRDKKSLGAFQIAGSDRQFVRANAEIDGNTVVVWSPEIENPVAVRYGWEQIPQVNLYDQNNLPASPFRTDEWPGMTVETRVNPRFKTRFK